jgi:seryl-tRNA synthetase
MHDLSYFRDHLDVFAEMAKRRNTSLDLDAFRAIDKERRELITANEHRKAQRNKASDEIARRKKEKAERRRADRRDEAGLRANQAGG